MAMALHAQTRLNLVAHLFLTVLALMAATTATARPAASQIAGDSALNDSTDLANELLVAHGGMWVAKSSTDEMTGRTSQHVMLGADTTLAGRYKAAIAVLSVGCNAKGKVIPLLAVSEPPERYTTRYSINRVDASIKFDDVLINDPTGRGSRTKWDFYTDGYGMIYTGASDFMQALFASRRILFRYTSIWGSVLTFPFTVPSDTRDVVQRVYESCGKKLPKPTRWHR